MHLTRIGVCNHCGACCYIWSNTLHRFHVCEAYTTKNPDGKCGVYGNEKRPKDCEQFPTCPEDLERVSKYCVYRFVDERGRVVEPWMNPKIRLTPLS
jgi:hypothetical protein